MNEMVERVAIRMWIDYVQSASPPVEWHKSKDHEYWLSVATERDRAAWRRSARAAIEAMRVPTAEMIDFARRQKPYDRDCADAWADMINEALR